MYSTLSTQTVLPSFNKTKSQIEEGTGTGTGRENESERARERVRHRETTGKSVEESRKENEVVQKEERGKN